MDIYQLLLKDKWITDKMIKLGLLPYKYSNSIKIYNTYKDYRNLNPHLSKNRAIVFTAKYYGYHRQTVWKVINELETEF